MIKLAFIIPPNVEILDLAGPMQVFTEARFYGFEVSLEFYSYEYTPVSTSGLPFGDIKNFKDADLRQGDTFLCQAWILTMCKAHLLMPK